MVLVEQRGEVLHLEWARLAMMHLGVERIWTFD